MSLFQHHISPPYCFLLSGIEIEAHTYGDCARDFAVEPVRVQDCPEEIAVGVTDSLEDPVSCPVIQKSPILCIIQP